MYRYYRSRKRTTDSFAYFEAIISLILAFMLGVFVLFEFFDLMNYLPNGSKHIPRFIEYLIGTFITLIIVYLISKLLKKEEVLKVEMDERQRRIGYRWIIFHIVFTFILIMYLAVTRITIYDLL